MAVPICIHTYIYTYIQQRSTVGSFTSQETWPLAAHMKIPGEQDDFTPAYVALDGKVLRFDTYIKEEMPEAPEEVCLHVCVCVSVCVCALARMCVCIHMHRQ
jgi:hypothetical protein